MEIVIIVCILLLIAYVFDITTTATRIPTVILLLLLGWLTQQAVSYFAFKTPDLTPLLSIMGTVGLILIVLEGALELDFNISKFTIVRKSFFGVLIPLLIMAFALAGAFVYLEATTWKTALTNAIPLCIISSAIAIPSARNLDAATKEFVTYESSLSDIIGVIAFNFIALNESIKPLTGIRFTGELLFIIFISLVATIGLALLLHKITHHVKFAPIILLIILIYAVSKIYHLPGLIFILLFGLFLGNIEKLKHYKWMNWINIDELKNEVHKFKDLTSEATFMVRSVFFILFGFLINTAELLDIATLEWSVSTVLFIFIIRYMQLRLLKLPVYPLLFVAPRGLITILLFLSISSSASISIVSKAYITQTILITALVMMFGLMATSGNGKNGSHKRS